MHSRRQLSVAILAALSDEGRAEHKNNLVGNTGQQGRIEAKLGKKMSLEERAIAARAFDKLVADGFIQPSYQPMASSSPDLWVVLTDAGRTALARGELDALDHALGKISPTLIEMRVGARDRITSESPDAVRHAAHSARELMNQVLQRGAPEGTTRRERLRLLMQATRGSPSDSDVDFADKAVAFALEALDRLTTASHDRNVPSRDVVEAALSAMETTLRLLLVRGDA